MCNNSEKPFSNERVLDSQCDFPADATRAMLDPLVQRFVRRDAARMHDVPTEVQ